MGIDGFAMRWEQLPSPLHPHEKPHQDLVLRSVCTGREQKPSTNLRLELGTLHLVLFSRSSDQFIP